MLNIIASNLNNFREICVFKEKFKYFIKPTTVNYKE